MDGHITKPIRFSDIEKTLTDLLAAPSAAPTGPGGGSMWCKAEALERLGGDEQLLGELCQIFLEESPKLLLKLRHAMVHTDAPEVMRSAHSLKGELGYLGAARASHAAQELEDMGHRNDLSHAPETLIVLEREMASLHLALKNSEGVIQ